MRLRAIVFRVLALCLITYNISSAGKFVSDSFVPRKPAIKISIDRIPDSFRSDRLILKFAEDTEVRLHGNMLMSKSGKDISLATSILSGTSGLTIKRLFSRSEASLETSRQTGQAMCNRQLADLNLYYILKLDESVDAVGLIAQLNELVEIETVYPEPIPVPASEPSEPATPDFQYGQGYLEAAPGGIDAYYAWGIPGAKGQGITVCDIEGNWVFTHEDLSKAHDDIHIAGSLIPEPLWYNHGTAVLGQIAADSNGIGVTGITYEVDLRTVSIGSMSVSDAIDTAAASIDPGDIILIELQDAGPNGGNYVPVEYYQDAFDAISTASANGRIVVEAAGNGHQDLDDSYWYGQLFDPDYRHSGAIMVGAGTPSTHWPESYTNYGQRLDLQGWGSEIYTLGYGDLYSEGDTAHWYTADFGGTSGASPIVVGSVAALRGACQHAYGDILTRDEIVDILQVHGTPQGNPSKHIGPLPDLRASLESQLAVFTADTRLGNVPLTVQFDGNSPDTPLDWTWDFGDGDSAFIEDPSHVYTQSGAFDVSLCVNTPSGTYAMNRPEYVVALLDSITFSHEYGLPGQTVAISVYGKNDFDIERFILSFRYAGDADLSYEYVTVEGTRCDYFENITLLAINLVTREITLRFTADWGGGSPPLPPGSGEIARIYFTVGSQTIGDISPIDTLDGLFSMQYRSQYGTYRPFSSNGSVTVSGPIGDVDASGEVDIDDVVYLIQYIFAGGPAPEPYFTGDADCSGTTDIDDVVFLIEYIFGGGPEPDC